MGAIFTWVGGAKFWLIAMALATAAAFAGGFYLATSQAETKMADRLATASLEFYSKGVEAQKNFDDNNSKRAKADYDKRHAADMKRVSTLEEALKAVPVLVPNNPTCAISAEAMKKLNEVAK